MSARAPLFYLALASVSFAACSGPTSDGYPCYESSECNGGSVCAETVYGNYCLETCSVETVFCENGRSCLQTEPLPDGAGGAGGDAGLGGAGGMAGMGGEGGMGGGGEERLWVCMPGDVQDPNFVPRIIGQICSYSIECEVGAVCVCIPGATCEGEGKNGPTCQRLCNSAMINQCPQILDIQPDCTDLGDGRGFCDPTTLVNN